jgi:serine/threonine protein kinase
MEYFPYSDLGKYIATGIAEHEAKTITVQLLQGLTVMHQNKFTHRDLKPEVSFVILILRIDSDAHGRELAD